MLINKLYQVSEIDILEMSGLRYGEDSYGLKKYASLDNSHDEKVTDYELENYFNDLLLKTFIYAIIL